MQRVRRLIFRSSSRRPEFVPSSIRMGFMVDGVTMGQVSLGILRSFSGSIIPPMLHIPASITDSLSLSIYITLAIDSVDNTSKNLAHVEQFKLIPVTHNLSLVCGGNYNNHRSVALRAPRIDTLQQSLP